MNGYVYATLVRTLARSHVRSPRSFSAAPVAFKVIQGETGTAVNAKSPQLGPSWGLFRFECYVGLALT